jgi:small subunit ribosomal protein S6
VIFAPTLGSDVLENATKKFSEVITAQGGTLHEIDNWGKRNLAYEINFHREGFYCFYRFKGGNEIIKELNRQLRIDENVIRHMIVRDELRERAKLKQANEETKVADEPRQDAEEGQ